MLSIVLMAMILGLSAGITPGPLLVLLISETLRHGFSSGIKVAIEPLITDLPIILLALYISINLLDMKPLLGSISLLGSLFVLYLAHKHLSIKAVVLEKPEAEKSNSLGNALLTNILSPHPYLSWFYGRRTDYDSDDKTG